MEAGRAVAIDPDDVARVRESTDIVALISEHIGLRKQGRRYVGLCPFHQEKTPSFSVNADDGFYYCFGCQRSGDAITFVRETENLDFPEAVRRLADRAGIAIRENHGNARSSDLDLVREALTRAVDFYHSQLLVSPQAGKVRSYLQSRGYGKDAIALFKLGYAPDGWDTLAKHLRLPGQVLGESGLGFVNRAGRQQDFMRDRIIFPIFDSGGRPIAMGGRVLPGSTEAKYKNTPETHLYSKRNTLYGLNLAKEGIVNSGQAIICEGYTDVIAFFQAGMPRAVATCGTALGEGHVNLLRRFTSNVVLAYDADQAGQSGETRFYEWERKGDLDVSVVVLPQGLDPADLANSNPEQLTEAVDNALPFMRFLLERIFESHDLRNPEGRARAARDSLAAVGDHPSALLRDQYLMVISDRCRIDVNLLRKELDALKHNGNMPRHAVQAPGREHHSPDKGGRGSDTGREAAAREGNNGAGNDHTTPAIRDIFSTVSNRAELEALRLAIQRPADIAPLLDSTLFRNDTLHAIYMLLAQAQTLQEAIDNAEEQDPTIATILRRLSVEEPTSIPLDVVRQLARKAATEACQEIEIGVRRYPDSIGMAAKMISEIKTALENMGDGAGDIESIMHLIASLQEKASMHLHHE
ncbi:MAG: DNA primase [Actinobacteria bacterium]|nr:DNA primase [Actinomycetota bacterium]MCL5446354.1 DNA primase [Actinomycetota bacterium]